MYRRIAIAVRAKVVTVKWSRTKVVTRFKRPLINSFELVEGRFFTFKGGEDNGIGHSGG